MSRYKWFGFFRRTPGAVTRQEANGPRDPSTGFEPRDVNATAVLLTGLGILLVMWAVVVLLYPLFSYFRAERGIPAAVVSGTPARRPTEPQIQPNPRTDLHAFRAREISELNTYRWVDRKREAISIPIERAIQLLAERGVPPSQPGGDQYYNPQAGTRETGFEGKVEPEPR